MRKAFLETSAVNRAVEKSVSADDLKSLLASQGFEIVSGMHVIYELAKTFLRNPAQGQKLFQLLSDLNPVFQKPVRDLLTEELLKLRSNAAVIPFANEMDQAAAKTEVARLSMGDLDDDARSFIEKMESDVSDGYPRWAEAHIEEIKRIEGVLGSSLTRLRSTDTVFEHLKQSGSLPGMIRGIYRSQDDHISSHESRELLIRLYSFPALKAIVRANCYLLSVCFGQRTRPGFDKIGDFRNVIEASYCDSIICTDRQLCTAAPQLSPGVEVIWPSQLA